MVEFVGANIGTLYSASITTFKKSALVKILTRSIFCPSVYENIGVCREMYLNHVVTLHPTVIASV
jgi:hypothetical protein